MSARKRRRPIKPSPSPRLLILVVALLGALLLSSSASAACWEDVIDDWAKDEQVGTDHPQKCYTEALEKMPQDLRYYSNAEDVIRAALREKRQGLRGLEGLEGAGEEDPGSSGSSGDNNGGSSGGPFQTALKVGPDNVDSIPLPLMIMAIAALMLIAAGGAGLVSRRLNARRAAPAAGEPPDTP